MEKNAIGQSLQTASQTTSAKVLGDQDATGIIAKNDETGKMSSVNIAGIDVSTDAGDEVINNVKKQASKKILGSVVPGSNEPAISDVVAETTTFDVPTGASSSPRVAESDDTTELVNKMARFRNMGNAPVTPSPIQQLVPGRAAAVATSRNPDQELTIRATASSWVEIVRSDGTAVLKKLMKTGETYVVDTTVALYLSTGNAGGIELVNAGDDAITIGAIGEIVRDLPLANSRLRERF